MANKERECKVCQSIISYQHKHKPSHCPNCSSKYWDKPKDERDLFLLQDIYIENGRNKDYLVPIYNNLLQYAENIIKYKLKNKVILNSEDLKKKADDIAILMIERYLKYPTEKIDNSFGGMMLRIANGVLYGQRKTEQELSINQHYLDSDKEMNENLFSLSMDQDLFNRDDPQYNFNIHTKEDVIQEISVIIEKIYEKIKKKKSPQNFLYLIGLKNFLEGHKDQFIRNYNNIISNDTKNNIEKTKLFLRNHLYGRC